MSLINKMDEVMEDIRKWEERSAREWHRRHKGKDHWELLKVALERDPMKYRGKRLLQLVKDPGRYSADELIEYANKLVDLGDTNVHLTCDPDGRGGYVPDLAERLFKRATKLYLHVLRTRPEEVITKNMALWTIEHNYGYNKTIKKRLERIRQLREEKMEKTCSFSSFLDYHRKL